MDPDGEKDRPFDAKTDRPISREPGTATPIYIYGQDGQPIAYAPNYKSAYNCHSFAWHNSQGDPTDPGNKSLVDMGITKWDNSPADDIPEQGAVQLKPDADNRLGDRVVYYVDKDANGKYDSGEEIVHSAIVETVDKEGYTTAVIGKMGQQETSVNHPDAPGYYRTNQSGQRTARAYFRIPEKKENEEVKP